MCYNTITNELHWYKDDEKGIPFRTTFAIVQPATVHRDLQNVNPLCAVMKYVHGSSQVSVCACVIRGEDDVKEYSEVANDGRSSHLIER